MLVKTTWKVQMQFKQRLTRIIFFKKLSTNENVAKRQKDNAKYYLLPTRFRRKRNVEWMVDKCRPRDRSITENGRAKGSKKGREEDRGRRKGRVVSWPCESSSALLQLANPYGAAWMQDLFRIKYESRIFFNPAESKRLFDLNGTKAFLFKYSCLNIYWQISYFFINSQRIIMSIVDITMLMRRDKFLQENLNKKSSIEEK